MDYRSKQQSSLLTTFLKPNTFKGWGLFVIVIAIGAAFVIGALLNELIFRLFVILFLISFAVFINRKLSYANSASIEEQPPVQMESEKTIELTDDEVAKKQNDLQKVDLDRTLLIEELFTKAALSDMEKQQYRQKIKQKDNEISSLMQEMMNAKNKIHQAVLETKRYFIKEDPIKEIAASLDKDSVLNGSIYDLNWALEEIRSSLSEEVISALQKSSYVDGEFKLTRNGYKALIKEVGKKTEDDLE